MPIDGRTVGSWERGEAVPNDERVERLAKVLRVDATAFFDPAVLPESARAALLPVGPFDPARLKQLILERGMTKAAVARRMLPRGQTPETADKLYKSLQSKLCVWIRGGYAPTVSDLKRLARALRVSVDALRAAAPPPADASATTNRKVSRDSSPLSAQEIRALRLSRGQSLEDFALDVGASAATLSRLENGRTLAARSSLGSRLARIRADAPSWEKRLALLVGEQLRRARNTWGLSIEEIAARIERSVLWLNQVERGTVSVGPEALDQVARALNERVDVWLARCFEDPSWSPPNTPLPRLDAKWRAGLLTLLARRRVTAAAPAPKSVSVAYDLSLRDLPPLATYCGVSVVELIAQAAAEIDTQPKRVIDADALARDCDALLEKIAEQIYRARSTAGMSREDFARLIGSTPTRVTKFEGARPNNRNVRAVLISLMAAAAVSDRTLTQLIQDALDAPPAPSRMQRCGRKSVYLKPTVTNAKGETNALSASD